MDDNGKLPEGWVKVKSKSRPDKFYFYNDKLKVSLWKIEDLKKFSRKSNGEAKEGEKETPTKSPSKKSPAKRPAMSPKKLPAVQSKVIKRNVAKDRMKALRKDLSSADSTGAKLKNLTDPQLVKIIPRPTNQSQAVDKKNGALRRMKDMTQQLQKEVKADTLDSSPSQNPKVPLNVPAKEEASEEMMDISFEEPSGSQPEEYEAMDWEDIPEQEVILQVHKIRTTEGSVMGQSLVVTEKAAAQENELIIIVDTNVLLSNIDFVREIKGKMFKDIGKAIIYLPYIVLCELDRLKSHDDNVARLARRAITFIDECFKAKDSWLVGQSARESAKRQIIPVHCGDDKILNCCLQIQETTKKVLLLTNDKNLRNKSFVNKIESYSRDMLNYLDYNVKNDIKFD